MNKNKPVSADHICTACIIVTVVSVGCTFINVGTRQAIASIAMFTCTCETDASISTIGIRATIVSIGQALVNV